MAAWHNAILAMAERLKTRSATQPLLLTASADMEALPGYGRWVAPPAANSTDTRVLRVLAAQGHAFAAFACAGHVVPPAVMNGLCITLKQLSGRARQQAWAEIAQNFPESAAEVKAWMAKDNAPAVQRLLVGLDLAWSIPLVSPAALVEEPLTARTARTQTDDARPQADDVKGVDADGEPGEDEGRPANLLGWLVQRANFAGMRSHFGADSRWDALTSAELTHVCKAIRLDLQARGDASRFALLAVVSLCSSLPARLAMSLSLRPSTDIWLANDFASLRWSLQRLLEGSKNSLESIEQLLPDHVVDIALPRDASQYGADLIRSRPHAADLAELLTGTAEPSVHRQFIEAYRAWLRALGPGWAHAVYDARFALSLSQILRARHGDVAAAWLSLDFREASLGMMHYVCLTRAMLHQWSSEAIAAVGLGDAATSPANGHVGSAIALDVDAFTAGWQSLQAACEAFRLQLASSADLAEAGRAITGLNTARLAATVIAMAGRGTLLRRLSWEALYAHADVVLLIDKRMDTYSDLRGIPVHALLREQLDAHLEDLQLFAIACRRLGHVPTDLRGRDLTRTQGQGVAFYGIQLRNHGRSASLRRTAISTGDIDAVALHHFGRPINVGRHTLLTLAVLEGWDPWWAKMLSGHHRGHAEPFSDGGVVAPAHALRRLRDALDRAVGQLAGEKHRTSSRRTVLELSQLPTHRALPPLAQQRTPGSKARMLPPAWQSSTLSALRVCEHLRLRLSAGEGPSHPGAEAQLTGLLFNAIPIDDLRIIWNDRQAFQALGDRSAAVLWRRTPGGQEQQRLIAPLWAVALLRAPAGKRQLPDWAACCEHAASWLRSALPDFTWASDDFRCLRSLEQLFQIWQRFHLPPFVLSAASPALGAAVPNRLSLCRLASATPTDLDDDVLILKSPAPRATARAPMHESPLEEVLKKVHYFARKDLKLGEDDQRWQDLAQAIMELDCSADTRAQALIQVVRLDCDRWLQRRKGRVEVSSFSTYLYRISDHLERIAPSEDLPGWREEWEDWYESVERSALSGNTERRTSLLAETFIAVRHLLRALYELKYPVPAVLLTSSDTPSVAPNRRSASATVLLQSTRTRVRDLLRRHFADVPLLCELADLYCTLVFEASLRSAEVGALPLDAITPFGDLVVDSYGFSHLKSEHARRLQHLPDEVVAAFHSVAALIQAAEPGARWIFLMSDPNNWSNTSAVAKALGVALRQVTGDADARQHATRPLAPLAQLLPGWEEMLCALVRGMASTQQCRAFASTVQGQGVGKLVQVLQAAGHGHPLTFLTHYFAVWPWVLAAFIQGQHADCGNPAALVRSRLPEAYAAFRKARERAIKANEEFDAWGWTGRSAMASLALPLLQGQHTPASVTRPLPPAGQSSAIGGSELLRYLAGRFMGLPPAAAAHAFGLTNAVAARAEAHADEQVAAKLRQRHQGSAAGRGRTADLKLLRSLEGATLAARLVVIPLDVLARLADSLSSQRTGPQPRRPIDVLIADLQSSAASLPMGYGLYVQTGQGRFNAEDLARIPASSSRLFLGPPDRDLGNRPRVSVVDATAPDNRVRRARLTSLVRCLVQAALAIRSK